jgi:hypothetical protein
MKRSQRGYIALTSVILVIAIIGAVATTITYVAIGEARSGLALFAGEDNLSFVEGCVEDYLLKIRSDAAFAGGNITRPEGTCTITINSGNPNWDITVTSVSTKYQRKMQVIFTRAATGITLTSWKEI